MKPFDKVLVWCGLQNPGANIASRGTVIRVRKDTKVRVCLDEDVLSYKAGSEMVFHMSDVDPVEE